MSYVEGVCEGTFSLLRNTRLRRHDRNPKNPNLLVMVDVGSHQRRMNGTKESLVSARRAIAMYNERMY